METKEIEHYFADSTILQENPEEAEELVNLAGYQVTKAELFAHTREPAITIWDSRIKFNMACLRRFSGSNTHPDSNSSRAETAYHPPLRPGCPRTPSAGPEAAGEKELSIEIFCAKSLRQKSFDLMGWNPQYRYKMMGKPAVCDSEMLYLFKLTDFELFVNRKKSKSYLPEDWRNYFGTPVDEHEDSYKINLADGYITTNKT